MRWGGGGGGGGRGEGGGGAVGGEGAGGGGARGGGGRNLRGGGRGDEGGGAEQGAGGARHLIQVMVMTRLRGHLAPDPHLTHHRLVDHRGGGRHRHHAPALHLEDRHRGERGGQDVTHGGEEEGAQFTSDIALPDSFQNIGHRVWSLINSPCTGSDSPEHLCPRVPPKSSIE